MFVSYFLTWATCTTTEQIQCECDPLPEWSLILCILSRRYKHSISFQFLYCDWLYAQFKAWSTSFKRGCDLIQGSSGQWFFQITLKGLIELFYISWSCQSLLIWNHEYEVYSNLWFLPQTEYQNTLGSVTDWNCTAQCKHSTMISPMFRAERQYHISI